MQSVQKKVSRRSRIGSAKLDYDSNLSAEDYEGVLWMKRSSNFRNNYVQTWCSLKDKDLFVYEKKDGKLLENINIEVCRITPVIKHGSLNFYFRIINDWSVCSLGTRDEKEYGIWITRLQYIASNNTIENIAYQDHVLKQFSRDECSSPSYKSDSIDTPNINSSHLSGSEDIYDVYDAVNENKGSNHVPNTENNRSPSLTFTDDVFIDGNDTIYNQSTPDNTDCSINNKFKVMRDLEREIRDKSLWLSKIDDVLSKSHIPQEIDLFFEEYQMQLSQ